MRPSHIYQSASSHMFCPPGFADVDETGTINLVDAAKEVRGEASLHVEGGGSARMAGVA